MYNKLCDTPSDINEHLPTLLFWAKDCESITEMGVRYCVSTFAFIEGNPKKLVCIDINHPSFYLHQEGGKHFAEVERLCREKGIDFQFIQASTLEIEIEPTDLLFIDTLHTYEHLSRELRLHGNNARKYIIMHDTVSCLELNQAIDEFRIENPQWSSQHNYKNNNGLVVLSRC